MLSHKSFNTLLEIPAQARVWHWQTTVFSEHQAFGNFYEAIQDLADSLVEKAICTERVEVDGIINLSIDDYIDSDHCTEILEEYDAFLRNDLAKELDGRTELLNIRDEMLAAIDQCLYMLSLS